MEKEFKTCKYCGVHSNDNSHGSNCRLNKEFNLSGLYLRCECLNPRRDTIVFLERDIKEFIKRLKEGIHDFNETELGDIGRNEFIDKLAGDKLV